MRASMVDYRVRTIRFNCNTKDKSLMDYLGGCCEVFLARIGCLKTHQLS